MATVESWGGTITDIGPIYPMVGTEGLLVIIGVVAWIVWHVIQAKREIASTRSRSGNTGARNRSNGSLPKRIQSTRSRAAIDRDTSSRGRTRLESRLRADAGGVSCTPPAGSVRLRPGAIEEGIRHRLGRSCDSERVHDGRDAMDRTPCLASRPRGKQ